MKKLFKRCPICGEKLEKFNLCKNCLDNLEFDPNHSYKIDGLRDVLVSFQYSGIGKELIKKFKFNGELFLDQIIGDLMIEKLFKTSYLSEFSNITYVPMTKKKKSIRGFNQSKILAQYIAKNLDLNLIESFEKIRSTKEQVGLDKNDRQKNIKDAFVIKNYSSDIIIVDDVITTGSTIRELVKLTSKEGIKTLALIAATQ